MLTRMERIVRLEFCFIFILSLSSSSTVILAETPIVTALTKENPLSAKASLIRYWNKHISNNLPKPTFLFSKASPLSHFHSAIFTKLASQHTLSSHLPSFCSSANLFCLLDNGDNNNSIASQSLSNLAQKSQSNTDYTFAVYSNKNFSNYGPTAIDGADSFTNYSQNTNFATSSFARYSQSSTSHQENFTSYADNTNVATSNFTSYAVDATGGSGEFTSYMPLVNVPNLRFISYSSDGNDHELNFNNYVGETNSGNEVFASYSKNGNGVPAEFSGYGDTSNVIGSTFGGYGELGNAANDSFTAYSSNANNPTNNFKLYGNGGNDGTDSFSSYRDQANAGKDMFVSYGRNSNSQKTNFLNYGKSFNQGVDMFREYGKESTGQLTGFNVYAMNATFKDYTKNGVTFDQYTNGTADEDGLSKASGSVVNKMVEPGKFFREHMLKEGTVMPMPDIRDRMPKRSFLPRAISSKLPFSTARLSEVKQVFKARDKSTMARMLANTLAECERTPSQGETKRCVGSVEDMIDFAASVLGRNLVVRTTEKINGSNQVVMIGKVKGINGGKITKSVSCHQSLYPYLLYYCHSVPKVRVYVADILAVETKAKINNGVAICHVDTSSWSPGHGAFLALGSGPGRIEVCHWIFENDMTWTTAD